MTRRKLAMPEYVADLIHMPLTRMGLDPFRGDDMITCSLMYEDGTELGVAFICVSKRGWFRERAVLLVSLVQVHHDTGAVTVHTRNTIECPRGPHDLEFVMLLPKLVSVIAWTHAARGGMGECADLPRPTR